MDTSKKKKDLKTFPLCSQKSSFFKQFSVGSASLILCKGESFTLVDTLQELCRQSLSLNIPLTENFSFKKVASDPNYIVSVRE